jgi:hypothetical protein
VTVHEHVGVVLLCLMERLMPFTMHHTV